MQPSAETGRLKANEWEQLQDLADRFEAAWQGAETVDLAQFLPTPDDSLFRAALHELIKSDLEIRWRRGQLVSLEHYRERFPALGPLVSLPGALVYEEYRVRQLYGDKPALAVYKARFPGQFEELQRLIREQPLRAASPAEGVAETRIEPKQGETKTAVAQKTLTVAGSYQMIKRIGTGGFGEVWRGEAPGGVEVAIKVIYRSLDHAEARRELDAVNLIKRLHHPFLLQTHCFWPEEDRLFIVMDLAEGNLRDRLKECRDSGLPGIPLRELITYFRESAEGLDYLHSEGVHHRDIKPDNILLLKRHAKLADFGLARIMESRMATATGSGTPAYMPPEIWQGKVSQHSDQYSLAMTYAELRLNRRLFASKVPAEIMLDHLQRMPDLEPLAKDEQEVLLRAMAKEPEKRFASCQEFMEALETTVADDLGRSSLRGLRSGGGTPGKTATAGGSAASDLATLAARPESRQSRESLSLPMEAGSPAPAWRGETPQEPGFSKKLGFSSAAAGLLLMAMIGVGGYWVSTLIPEPGPNKPDPVLLPDNECRSADGAKVKTINGRDYYDHIIKDKGGQQVDFRLIPAESPSDPPTFYMMENKAWNDLFRAFMADMGSEAHQAMIKAGRAHSWTIRNEWERGGVANQQDLGVKDGRLPVFRVTVTEAHYCAAWLGGQLPTARQWDQAAGRYRADRLEGPYRQWVPGDKQQIAVRRGDVGPLPVGMATQDISPYSCRDMAGNGQEWTRSLRLDSSRTVPLPTPREDDLVELRGSPYFLSNPMKFADLESPKLPPSEPYGTAKPHVSFRVVLEISSSK